MQIIWKYPLFIYLFIYLHPLFDFPAKFILIVLAIYRLDKCVDLYVFCNLLIEVQTSIWEPWLAVIQCCERAARAGGGL